MRMKRTKQTRLARPLSRARLSLVQGVPQLLRTQLGAHLHKGAAVGGRQEAHASKDNEHDGGHGELHACADEDAETCLHVSVWLF